MEVIGGPILLQEPNVQLRIAVIPVCSHYIPICKVEFIYRAHKADIWQSYVVESAKHWCVLCCRVGFQHPHLRTCAGAIPFARSGLAIFGSRKGNPYLPHWAAAVCLNNGISEGVCHWSGRFLGITGWDPYVFGCPTGYMFTSSSFPLLNWGTFFRVPLKWSVLSCGLELQPVIPQNQPLHLSLTASSPRS